MASPALYRPADRPSPRALAKPRVAAALFAAVLAACGGGGGGGGGDGGGGGGGGGGTAHAIGGRVDGLTASGLVLQNNGGNNLSIGAAGAFRFTQTVAHGGAYAVTVFTQPQGQACSVAHGSGTANDDVSSVVVTCASTPPPPPPQTHTVGGSISGLTSAGLVLRNNGGDGITLAAGATSFTFPTPVARGGAYSVTIGSQPQGNDCTLANASGTIAQANVSNVQVSCGAVGPLTLVSSNPAANATNVPRDVVPSFTFSAPLDAATVGTTARLTVSAGGSYLPVTAEPVMQGAQLGMRTPGKLLPAARYALDVRNSLRGTRGEQFAGSASTLFTTAEAEWGGQQSFGYDAFGTSAAGNLTGDAVVTWIGEPGPTSGDRLVMASVFNAVTQQWSGAMALGTTRNSLADAVRAAVSSSGDIAVVWSEATGGRVLARHRVAATGTWGRAVEVHPSWGGTLELTAQPDGRLFLLAQANSSTEIHAFAGRAGDSAAWSPAGLVGSALTDAPFSILGAPRAVALPDGGAMVVWEEYASINRFYGVVRARRLDAAGVPLGAAPDDVSLAGTNDAAHPVVAVQRDPGSPTDYTVYVAWRWAGDTEHRILLRRWSSASGAWEYDRATAIAEMTVATAARDNDTRMGRPAIAAITGPWSGGMPPVRLVWAETSLAVGSFRLRGSEGGPRARWGEAEDLIQLPAPLGEVSSVPGDPKAMMDRAGNLHIVYEHPLRVVASEFVTELRSLRRQALVGSWSSRYIGGPVSSRRKDAALAGAGETGSALVSWSGRDSSNRPIVEVRRFD